MTEDYSKSPDRIMQNLLHYVDGTEAPGGFLYAVLCNDLFQAIARADSEMKILLPVLVSYIHWKLPLSCHGSPELVKIWMNKPKNEKGNKL